MTMTDAELAEALGHAKTAVEAHDAGYLIPMTPKVRELICRALLHIEALGQEWRDSDIQKVVQFTHDLVGTFTRRELVRELPDLSPKQISNALAYLVRSGKLIKRGYGAYSNPVSDPPPPSSGKEEG
jgi:hypothetical protein